MLFSRILLNNSSLSTRKRELLPIAWTSATIQRQHNRTRSQPKRSDAIAACWLQECHFSLVICQIFRLTINSFKQEKNYSSHLVTRKMSNRWCVTKTHQATGDRERICMDCLDNDNHLKRNTALHTWRRVFSTDIQKVPWVVTETGGNVSYGSTDSKLLKVKRMRSYALVVWKACNPPHPCLCLKSFPAPRIKSSPLAPLNWLWTHHGKSLLALEDWILLRQSRILERHLPFLKVRAMLPLLNKPSAQPRCCTLRCFISWITW